jgi:hypothetical protein
MTLQIFRRSGPTGSVTKRGFFGLSRTGIRNWHAKTVHLEVWPPGAVRNLQQSKQQLPKAAVCQLEVEAGATGVDKPLYVAG